MLIGTKYDYFVMNLHGRTKAVMKNDVLESGGEQIKAEGIVFVAG